MIELAKNTIENVTVTLTVEETVGSELGGYPMLNIGDVLIESTMVQEVDTLAMIKAITTATNVKDFEEKVLGVWNSEWMVVLLKSFAYENMENEGIILDTVWNDRILHMINKYLDFIDYYKTESPNPKRVTEMEASIYDLHQKLQVAL